MGRKSSAKADSKPPVPPSSSSRSTTPLAIGVVLLVLVAGGVAYWSQAGPAAPPTQAAAAQAATPPAAPAVAEVPEINKRPRPQRNLPPLNFPAHPMARSSEVVRANYQFAAVHPEVLSYMPCFCGCEHQGHRGNEDCFVQARDVQGNVIEWNDHGMECAICLDVATKAREMFVAGTPLPDIRAAVDKEWAARATNHTPTPHPDHH